MKVHADAGDGHRLSFDVSDPPTAEDLRRWAGLATMPGLVDAVWRGSPEIGRVPVAPPTPAE